MTFSALHRSEIISTLKSKYFDLLVIGGGITGVGIALDAALRGLSVALVEKNDFAYGTSSRSTKLIHGGLRYLKQLEFGLVKEVGSERAIVHRLATHLVVPEKMLLPLSEGKSMGYLLTSIGLKIYDWLAGVKEEDKRKMLTRPQTLNAEPLLKKEGIKGGALYAEYRTDDARLTIEIAKSAVKYGAVLCNHIKVKDFTYDINSKLTGVECQNEINQDLFDVKARTVVNATGPWVDELRGLNKSLSEKRLHLTKGVHIVVNHFDFPVRQAIYFEVSDGRMIFAIPRGGKTYVGTTDTNYSESKDKVQTRIEDASYLIEAVNQNFDSVHLTLRHIESSWAGLRPLIHEEGKSASELSRKDEIFISDSGLISIAGGKLTGYRKMAERVVDLVIDERFSDREFNPCNTNSVLLYGNSFKNYKHVIQYKLQIERQLALSNLQHLAGYYVSTYGDQSDFILLQARQSGNISEASLLEAELEFCLSQEMAVLPEDFLVRRTAMLYFNISKLRLVKGQVLKFYQSRFNWDERKLQSEKNKLDSLIEESTVFN